MWSYEENVKKRNVLIIQKFIFVIYVRVVMMQEILEGTEAQERDLNSIFRKYFFGFKKQLAKCFSHHATSTMKFQKKIVDVNNDPKLESLQLVRPVGPPPLFCLAAKVIKTHIKVLSFEYCPDMVKGFLVSVRRFSSAMA